MKLDSTTNTNVYKECGPFFYMWRNSCIPRSIRAPPWSHIEKRIKTVEELKRLTNQEISKKQSRQLQEVLEKYPVQFTGHLFRLMRRSKEIAIQFLPNVLELEKYGTIAPFEEGLHASEIYGFERLYTDRAIVTLTFDCPAYCRFCFRKGRVLSARPTMTYEDIDKAVKFIKVEKDINGILITGGDPFTHPNKLLYLVEKLSKIDHLLLIRIGTRSFLYQPQNLTAEIAQKLSKFVEPNPQKPCKSKTLWVVTHFNHPDEITSESVKAFQRFTNQGIVLRSQTVLLRGVNDNYETLRKLFETLIANNVIPYYLFHCMPIEGCRHLRTSVQKGIDFLNELSKLSALVSPHYAVVTQIGKIRLIGSSKLNYRIKKGQKYIILKSPYMDREFLKNTNQKQLPENCYSDKNDFIIVDYLDGED